MATAPKTSQQQHATAALKDERAKDAALAMKEYQAEQVAVLAKTANLRALRMAKQAESVVEEIPEKPVKEKRAHVRRRPG